MNGFKIFALGVLGGAVAGHAYTLVSGGAPKVELEPGQELTAAAILAADPRRTAIAMGTTGVIWIYLWSRR